MRRKYYLKISSNHQTTSAGVSTFKADSKPVASKTKSQQKNSKSENNKGENENAEKEKSQKKRDSKVAEKKEEMLKVNVPDGMVNHLLFIIPERYFFAVARFYNVSFT